MTVTYAIAQRVAIAAATILVLAVPAWAQNERRAETSSAQGSAQVCPPGTHWVEGSYVHHGKWRSAHCERGRDIR